MNAIGPEPRPVQGLNMEMSVRRPDLEVHAQEDSIVVPSSDNDDLGDGDSRQNRRNRRRRFRRNEPESMRKYE